MVSTIVIKGVVWIWCSRIPTTAVRALAQDAENDGQPTLQYLITRVSDRFVFSSLFQHNVLIVSGHWTSTPVSPSRSCWRHGPQYIYNLAMVYCESLRFSCRRPMLISSTRPSRRTSSIVRHLLRWHLCESSLGVRAVSGRQADPHEISRVLYLVSRFRAVQAISAVEVYHIGDEIVIEVRLMAVDCVLADNPCVPQIDVILPRTSSLHYAHDIGETIQYVHLCYLCA